MTDVSPAAQDLGCVIMASGLGARFGGNKLLADFRGRPLIQGVLDATDGLFGTRVVVTRNPETAAYCREQGLPVLLHSLPHRSDTIRLGLDAIGPRQGCLFCPGDQPLLRRESVAAMVNAALDSPEAILRAAWLQRPGSPVLFPARYFPELRNLTGSMGGGVLLNKYPGQIRLVSVRDEWELMDVDTPQDLAVLVEHSLG